MWCSVGPLKTNVSGERVASIFRVEEIYASEETCWTFPNRLNYSSKNNIPKDGILYSCFPISHMGKYS
jgi:hypothetical protein